METCCKKSRLSTVGGSAWSLLYLAPLRFYRYVISPMLGPHCRFEPSCSHYAEEALLEYGLLKGLFLTLKRLGKCHPWHAGGYDPVPARQASKD